MRLYFIRVYNRILQRTRNRISKYKIFFVFLIYVYILIADSDISYIIIIITLAGFLEKKKKNQRIARIIIIIINNTVRCRNVSRIQKPCSDAATAAAATADGVWFVNCKGIDDEWRRSWLILYYAYRLTPSTCTERIKYCMPAERDVIYI